MPPITFDTSVLKSYKPVDFPAGFVFSAVVIQEMRASAADDSELKRWAAAWGAYEREDRLIVPTSADWLLASKVLYWLMQKRRKRAGGKSPPLRRGAEDGRVHLKGERSGGGKNILTAPRAGHRVRLFFPTSEAVSARDPDGRARYSRRPPHAGPTNPGPTFEAWFRLAFPMPPESLRN